jgi:hypothetical protein
LLVVGELAEGVGGAAAEERKLVGDFEVSGLDNKVNLQSSFADGTAAFGVAGRTYGVCGGCQVWLLVVAGGVDCCLEGAFDVCLG